MAADHHTAPSPSLAEYRQRLLSGEDLPPAEFLADIDAGTRAVLLPWAEQVYETYRPKDPVPIPPARFRVNDTVQLRSDPRRAGVVRKATWTAERWEYAVFFAVGDQPTHSEPDLEPYHTTGDPLELLARGQHAPPGEFARFLLLQKLERPRSDHLYSLVATRTDFEAYQFKPVIKFLNSPYRRLLIADEVGLGKTIEAGLIYSELRARTLDDPLSGVLILCPAKLVPKWRDELQRRFDAEFQVMGAPEFKQYLEGWRLSRRTLRGICSLESLRLGDIEARVRDIQPQIDLLIVDEAHYVRNSSSRTHHLVDALCEQSDAVVFLTATPLHTGDENLFNLLRLLVPEQYDSLDTLRQQLAPAEHVNALRSLVGEALERWEEPFWRTRIEEHWKQLFRSAQGERIGRDPRFRKCLSHLTGADPATILSWTEAAASDPWGIVGSNDRTPEDGFWRRTPDREALVSVQRTLLDLHPLSQVFTRTRKREIDWRPVRDPATLPVTWLLREREVYDAITELCRYRATRQLNATGNVTFATVMPQRRAASCLPATACQFLRTVEAALADPQDYEFPDLSGPEEALDPGASEEAFPLADPGGEERLLLERVRAACEALGDLDTKFDVFSCCLEGLMQEMPAGRQRVLVFSYFRGTLDYLERRLSGRYRVGVIHGGIAVPDRGAVIEQFWKGEIELLLSSEVGGEGLDLQCCNVMVNYDLPWNPMVVEQRIGRLDRRGQESQIIRIFNLSVSGTIEERIFELLYDRIELFRRSIGDLEAILGSEIHELTRDVFRMELNPEQQRRRAEQAALAILNRQREQDEFEQKHARTLMNDSWFTDEIESIRRHRRYLTEEEIESFVRPVLAETCPGTRLLDTGTPGLLQLVDEGRLTALLLRLPRAAQAGLAHLLPILRSGDARVTFRKDVARQYGQPEFLTAVHPIVQALRVESTARQRAESACTAIRLELPHLPTGPYAFFLYELRTTGLREAVRAAPIAVRLETGELSAGVGQAVLDAFAQGVPETWRPPSSAEGTALCAEAAASWIARIREQEQEEARAANQGLIDARALSLRQTFEGRIRRLEERRRSDTDPRIARMLESQVQNEPLRLQQKLDDLERKRQVEVSSRLVATSLVMIAHAR